MTDCWILDDAQGQSWRKEAPVAHYSCQRWQVREASGRSIATSSASAHSIELASSICNFKAPGSALERCAHVCVCLFGVCARVLVRGSLLICVPWVSHSHSVPLCAERVRGREAHLDMRSQIIHLTLRQEARRSAGERNCRRARGAHEQEKSKQESERCEPQGGQEEADWTEEKTVTEKVWVFERASSRDGAKKKMRAAGCYCAFLSGRQSDFIALSLTMCSGGFSVSMMTIANL